MVEQETQQCSGSFADHMHVLSVKQCQVLLFPPVSFIALISALNPKCSLLISNSVGSSK